MTPERWRRINDLFHAALERRDEHDRRAWVAEATREDPSLLPEVESLLRAHDSATGFLERPAWGEAPELMFEAGASLTGRTIGPYHVVEEIGRGGMGVVYAAEDTRLGRRVALKALTPNEVSAATHRERLRREARAAASLTHPSIATVYALEEIDGELFIVSELVRGRNLREEIGEGALPRERLEPTLLEIADGLAAAHAQGIVHRDLKPENVMRTTEGRVKILDFGLARVIATGVGPTATQLTQVGAALGTPGYMAPEQWSGGSVDARSDVFSFGVLAAELATGSHPFGTDSAAMIQRMTLLMEGKPVSGSGTWTVPQLEGIARRCMRADPSERYGSGTEVLAALRHVLGHPERTGTAPLSNGLWWWQFHQGAMAVALASMPALAWIARTAMVRPRGSWLFFAALVMATVSITARMNLVFTARVDPGALTRQRRKTIPWLPVMDAGLALLMIVAAVGLAGEHDALAGFFLSVGAVIIMSVAFIEPATSRAAGIDG